jgi:hypothetical protein
MGRIILPGDKRFARTRDSGAANARTQDSNLAYYVNQLDNFDQRLHEPLVGVTWGRDIKLRTGITMASESTSFTRSSFAGGGTQEAQGKPWISPETTTIPGVSVNGERIVTPLRLLGREVSYTSVELERSQLLGQPVDTAKLNALNTLYQMNTDEQVYIGDTFTGDTGLVNSAQVATGNVVGGTWAANIATPDVILAQVNAMLTEAWTASAYTICPTEVRLPPAQFGAIAMQKVSGQANMSVLEYIKQNSIATNLNGRAINIQPLKWLTGRGVGGTDRMMCYVNEEDRVRFPMVPIRRETAYYQGIRFISPYIWAFGAVEFVYPETVLYRDGI